MIVANDIGTKRYQKNPLYNEILVIDSDTAKQSGWKKKEKIVGFIIKEIEKRISKTNA